MSNDNHNTVDYGVKGNIVSITLKSGSMALLDFPFVLFLLFYFLCIRPHIHSLPHLIISFGLDLPLPHSHTHTCILYRCKIDWKKGMNVTVKTIKKKQKNKGEATLLLL